MTDTDDSSIDAQADEHQVTEDEDAVTDPTTSRRSVLSAAALLGVLGLGSGFAAGRSSAAAQPSSAEGQVGTASRPIETLHAAEISGPVTGGTAVTDLLGPGLSVQSGALTAAGASQWIEADADDLLEPRSPATGIDVSAVETDELAGSVTGGTITTDLTGSGLGIDGGALGLAPDGVETEHLAAAAVTSTEIDLASIAGRNLAVDPADGQLDAADGNWTDGDADDLLEPRSPATGIDVAGVYADSLGGPITGGVAVTSLLGTGLEIQSGELAAPATANWEEADSDGLLETAEASIDGVDVSRVRAATSATTDDATAVRGSATGSSGRTYGVEGRTASEGTEAAGVRGVASATGATVAATGVEGVAEGGTGVGVVGRAPNDGTGVRASASSNGRALRADGEAIVNDRMTVRTSIDAQLATDVANYPLFVDNESTDTGNLVLGLRTGYTGDPQTGHNFVQFLSADGSGGQDFNGTIQGDGSGGVTYKTSGADYAEFLPRRDPEADLEAGEVVGVHAEGIAHETEGASRVLVVSNSPNVAGNAPEPGSEDDYETVAFLGQVPVTVRGTADHGDLVIPSGDGDGTAVAVPAEEWEPGTPIVGQAWADCEAEGVSEVTVAVGVVDPGPAASSTTDRLAERDDRIADLEAENGELRDRNAELEARIERLEAAVGLDDGAPADGEVTAGD